MGISLEGLSDQPFIIEGDFFNGGKHKFHEYSVLMINGTLAIQEESSELRESPSFFVTATTLSVDKVTPSSSIDIELIDGNESLARQGTHVP